MAVNKEVNITKRRALQWHYLNSELSLRCVTRADSMIFCITSPWLRIFSNRRKHTTHTANKKPRLFLRAVVSSDSRHGMSSEALREKKEATRLSALPLLLWPWWENKMPGALMAPTTLGSLHLARPACVFAASVSSAGTTACPSRPILPAMRGPWHLTLRQVLILFHNLSG